MTSTSGLLQDEGQAGRPLIPELDPHSARQQDEVMELDADTDWSGDHSDAWRKHKVLQSGQVPSLSCIEWCLMDMIALFYSKNNLGLESR